jgi:thermitase
MNMSKALFLMTIALLLVSLFLHEAPLLAQGPITDPAGANFVPGEILVKFKPGVRRQDTQQKLAEVQGNVVRSISGIDVLTVKVPEGREQEAIAKLQTQADVVYAEPNYIVQALDIPNDPHYSTQWGLSKINMPLAWDITTGNSNVIVAIIDTGIDLEHPDFNCEISPGVNKLTAGYNFFSTVTPPDDDHYASHGTHVAGIAGACTDNALGVAGVAPNVQLMPVKVLASNGNGTSEGAAAGIIHAVDYGSKVLNLSLGAASVGIALQDAVNYAYNHGALVVAASGNAGLSPVYYPAAYDKAVAVGSTTSSDTRSSFSNYGTALDVVAPGSSIYSTVIGSYGSLNGTSMATPFVSGLAALIWSVDPGLTHDQVRLIIQDTAVDLGAAGWDEFYGYGRIDAFQALERFSVTLHEPSGQDLIEPISFLVDDDTAPLPPAKVVQITTANPDTITWSAAISPTVPWLSIAPPGSGTISASSANYLTLISARPTTYGIHSTTLVVTGVISSGMEIGSSIVEVKINYVPELVQIRLPVIVKN